MPFAFRLLLVAILGLVTTACDKDNDRDGNDDSADWGFTNTVNRDAFALRLKELDVIAAKADRVAVPKSETRRSGALRSFGVAADFAGVQSSGSGSADTGEDCANLVGIFGLDASTPQTSGSYELDAGDSCGAAIGSIKSFYSQALDALRVQATSLGKLEAGTVRCGMKIEDLNIDGSKAAMAYRLTAVDAPVGQVFQQDVMGGANAENVAFMTRLKVGCSDSKACGDIGVEQLSIAGASEAIGNTIQGTLSFKNDFDLSFTAGETVASTIKSTATITGLKGEDKLKVDEAAEFSLTATGGEDAISRRIALTMTVEELEDQRLKLTGSVDSDDAVLGKQTFTTVLSKANGYCRVLGEDEWQDQVDPNTPNPPANPDGPAPTFGAAQLEGTWLSSCESSSIGRLGYPRYEERLTYGAGGSYSHLLTTFGDNECYPGKEAAHVELVGAFAATEALAKDYNNRWEYGVNYDYTQLRVTLLTDELVSSFNTAAVCNKTDWAKATVATFDAGVCYFDLGSYALLNMAALKRTREYSAFVVEAPTIADFVRTSDFYGDDGDLGRARAEGGSERKLRKLPE